MEVSVIGRSFWKQLVVIVHPLPDTISVGGKEGRGGGYRGGGWGVGDGGSESDTSDCKLFPSLCFVSGSPGTLLKLQIPGPYPDLLNQISSLGAPKSLVFK